MAAGESVIHYYAQATFRLCLVIGIGAVVIGYVWYKWVKGR